MAEDGKPSQPPALLVWCLASFHAALLVVLLVAGLHLAGAVGDLLSGAGTWPGVAAYGYLWAVTWWTTRRWLESVPSLADRPAGRPVVLGALRWGAVAGLLLVAPVLVLVVIRFLAGGGVESVPIVLLVALVGALLAAGVGGLVGVTFASLDLLLVRAAGRLVPPDGATTPDAAP